MSPVVGCDSTAQGNKVIRCFHILGFLRTFSMVFSVVKKFCYNLFQVE